MTDEIYRPQRPNQNPQQSNPMQNLPHQHPAFNPAMQPEPVPPHIAQRMEVEDESKVKISGNIPPKLLERLQKTGGAPEQQAPVFTNAPSINTFSKSGGTNKIPFISVGQGLVNVFNNAFGVAWINDQRFGSR